MEEEIDLNSTLQGMVSEMTGAATAEKATDAPAAEETKDAPTAEKAGEDGATEETGADGDSSPATYVPDDALVERAVKAGVSMADAKAFPNAEMAERIIKAFEEKSAPAKESQTNDANVGGDDLSALVGEFTEENGYDPSLVKVVNHLVKKVSALESAGKSAAVETFFDSKFSGLDDAVRSHVDAVRKSQLKSKFDLLKSAYASANADVSDEKVFEEAVALTCGDLVRNAEAESKAAKAAKRKTMAIARPGGESGTRRGGDAPMSGDDIVNELFAALGK